MLEKKRKTFSFVQRLIDAAAKRGLFVLAAFAKSCSHLFALILAIVAVFNLPAATHPEVLFWLRFVVAFLASIWWALMFYEAYKDVKR